MFFQLIFIKKTAVLFVFQSFRIYESLNKIRQYRVFYIEIRYAKKCFGQKFVDI